MMGRDAYIELIRRIVRILDINRLGNAIDMPLPEGYTVNDLVRMHLWMHQRARRAEVITHPRPFFVDAIRFPEVRFR